MYINKPFLSTITLQYNYKKIKHKLCNGLYVYPSNESISKLKNTVKTIFKKYDYSVYRIIEEINPIIRI